MKPFIHKYVHILFCVMLGVLTFYVIPYHKMKLSAKVQREILGELGSTQQLRESLDTLETVMAFLAPAVGVSVNMKLSTFAENLKMQFSSKVSSWCYVIWCNIHIKNTTTLPVVTCLVIMGDNVYSPGSTACYAEAGIIFFLCNCYVSPYVP